MFGFKLVKEREWNKLNAELEKELEQIKNDNKEEPLQVSVFDSECDSMGRCPVCGYVVFCLDNYCKNCGQAIQAWNPWENRE